LLFSQNDIDTSKVKSHRIEWTINHKTKDTSKLTTLTEYTSGLFKEILYLGDQPGTMTISAYKRTPTTIDSQGNFLIHDIGYTEESMIIRNYLDRKGSIDSTYISSKKEGFKDSVYVTQKRKNIFGKLKWMKTWEGEFHYYYSIFGNLKRILFTSDNATQIRYYKNNQLIRKELGIKHKRIKSYAYNDKGLLIKAMISKREFEVFEYDNQGNIHLKKTFGVYNSGNVRLIETTKYTYENGLLLRSDRFSRKNELTFSSVYEYKNGL
jgi:hypothetical protein